MNPFLRTPTWPLKLWLVASIAMLAWAYLAYPPVELRMTLLMTGVGLVAIVVLAAMGKFDKRTGPGGRD